MYLTLVRSTYDSMVCRDVCVWAYKNGRLMDLDESVPAWDLFSRLSSELTVLRYQLTLDGEKWADDFVKSNARAPQLAEIPGSFMERR